jgi:hypothetical protein
MSNAYDPFYDDEDRAYSSNYCKHGTFIGNPYGADYMCGWCEDGTSDEEFQAWIDGAEQRRVDDALTRLSHYDRVVAVLEQEPSVGSFGMVSNALEGFALSEYFRGVAEVLDRNDAWAA